MTSFKQIDANRRNARKSTGPMTAEGKQRSRCNAIRHGLTAETVIGALEDAEDYKAFEASIIADYDAQSAVERELVLRLASLLWRLRRATTMETGLFEIQADHLREFRLGRRIHPASREIVYAMFGRAESTGFDRESGSYGRLCWRWVHHSKTCEGKKAESFRDKISAERQIAVASFAGRQIVLVDRYRRTALGFSRGAGRERKAGPSAQAFASR